MNKSKKKLSPVVRRIIGIATLALACAATLWFVENYYLMNNDQLGLLQAGFYMEDEDSLDVVMIGASELYMGYVPAVAYRDYGITSYNYCVQSGPVYLWKYQVEEILKRQSPQLIIIEVNGATYDQEGLDRTAPLRIVTDHMPLSMNKINLVKEHAFEDELSYIVPLIKYHSNWSDFRTNGKNMLGYMAIKKSGYNLTKGYMTYLYNVNPGQGMDLTEDYSSVDLYGKSEEYLRDFLEYCKEKDVNVLFIRYPHIVSPGDRYRRYQCANRIGEIAGEYGYDFLNLDRHFDEIGLDFATDFRDGEHLNFYGSEKTTDYLIKYCIDNYGLTATDKSESQTVEWACCVGYYEKMRRFYDDNMMYYDVLPEGSPRLADDFVTRTLLEWM